MIPRLSNFLLKFLLVAAFSCFQLILFAQRGAGGHPPGFVPSIMPARASNASSAIATSYTMTSCGLSYTQASVRLAQRSFGAPLNSGVPQPATLAVSGLPTTCKNILKAFLYVGVAGNGTAIAASLTNPANTNSVYPMSKIGHDEDLCWGYDSTFTYRADVTSIITGNGNYVISGIPVDPNISGPNDADGATLFIIYTDPSQLYTGSIVIADGCQSSFGSSYIGSTITGFSVCANATLTSGFMLLADLQQLDDTYISFNTPTNTNAAPNYTKQMTTDQVWDFVSGPAAPALAGQTSANFGMYNSGDCVGLMMAGMYYRTSCLTCTSVAMTLSASITASCPASATITPAGGLGPFTYTWTGTPTQQTTSVLSGMNAGSYTITVEDQACHTATSVVTLSTPAPTINLTSAASICKGEKTKLIAGPAATYSWSGTAITPTSANTATAIVSPTANVTYTLVYTNTLGCTNTRTVSVKVVNCTGINEAGAADDGLLVYPNPGHEEITISGQRAMTLQIINALGQCVKTVSLKEENNYEFSVKGLPKGLYYLTTPLGTGSFKRKIIIE